MHYYQHHIGDFIKATARLTDSQSMAYLRLIWKYYDDERPLPDEIDVLAFQVGASESDVSLILRSYFKLEDDGWHQSRCDTEIAEYHQKREQAANAGKASARARMNKGLTDVEQPLNGLSTNHKPLTNNQEPLTSNQIKTTRATRFDAVQHLVSLGVFEQVAKDYCQQRKKKPTMTAIDGIYKQAQKAGISLNKALEICCARGWEGFKAEWIKDKANNQQLTPYQQSVRSAGLSIFGDVEKLYEDGIINVSPSARQLDSKDI